MILQLAPAKESGYEVCNGRSKGCTNACLFSSGMGRFDNVKNGRIRKTKLFFEDREEFKRQLYKDIEALIRKGKRENKKVAIRLNGVSDLKFEEIFPDMFKKFKNVIVSGSMITWGKEWETSFDLVIFMHLENNERMKRLEKGKLSAMEKC